MTDATPRPWKRGQAGNLRIYGPDGMGLHSGIIATIHRHQDIALIVRAVNSHDALVSALGGMVDHYTALVNCGDCGHWNPEEERPVQFARAALAAAKEAKP